MFVLAVSGWRRGKPPQRSAPITTERAHASIVAFRIGRYDDLHDQGGRAVHRADAA